MSSDTEKNNHPTSLLTQKPGYASPKNYALAAVENAANECVHVPVLATEEMIRYACLTGDVAPEKAQMIYEIMTQAAHLDINAID